MIQINREQIKDLANLYDIKTLSQAIVEKGWACLSHNTRKDISKNSLPTVFNDILNKFINAEEGFSSDVDYTHFDVLYDRYTQKCIWHDFNGYWYISENLDLSNPQSFELTELDNDNQAVSKIICGENINVVFGNFDNRCYIYDKSWNFIKKYDLNAYGGYKKFYKAIQDYIILCFYDSDNSKTYIIKINDNTTADYVATPNLFDYDMEHQNFHLEPYRVSKVYNGYLYISCIRGPGLSLLKLNINDFTQYTEYETNISDSSIVSQVGNSSINMTELVIADNTYYLGAGEKMYSSSNLTTWTEIFDIQNYCYCLYQVDTSFYLVTNGNIYVTTDFLNYNPIIGFNESSYNYRFYFFYADANTLVCSMSDPDCYIYGTNGKKEFIDSYFFQGTDVQIKYFKNGNFRICIADTYNDANLDTVYNYLGYSNYFVLDFQEETVALPRNSNLWTMMYVGDNYEDSNLPLGNATRLLPQPEVITIDGSEVELDIESNKIYKLTAFELEKLTINSCENSALKTIIRFRSGSTATQIIDNSNIDWADDISQPSTDSKCMITIWDNTGFYKEW